MKLPTSLCLFCLVAITPFVAPAAEPIPAFTPEVEALLTEIQQAGVRYFYDFGHPVSGLAREGSDRNPDLCAIGASGMGFFNLIVAVERGFVTRGQAAERLQKTLRFLPSGIASESSRAIVGALRFQRRVQPHRRLGGPRLPRH